MKKIFLTALGVFAFALMFSFQTENNNLVKNSAFANHTCCFEPESMCPKSSDTDYGWQIGNHVKRTGSCKATTELEIAP